MELSASEYSIHELPGGKYLEELIECNNRLGQNLDEGDWDTAQRMVEARHNLLQQLAGVIETLDRDSTEDRILTARNQIRSVLQNLTETNEKYVEALTESICSAREKLLEIRKGRHTLNLYKRPRTQNPRFLNKVG